MIDLVAAWIRDAERAVVLTGAGVSAESGVLVFRGPAGPWRRRFRPQDLATPAACAVLRVSTGEMLPALERWL
jgi:NAD-dependent deacetylase